MINLTWPAGFSAFTQNTTVTFDELPTATLAMNFVLFLAQIKILFYPRQRSEDIMHIDLLICGSVQYTEGTVREHRHKDHTTHLSACLDRTVKSLHCRPLNHVHCANKLHGAICWGTIPSSLYSSGPSNPAVCLSRSFDHALLSSHPNVSPPHAHSRQAGGGLPPITRVVNLSLSLVSSLL